ncbi:hypothetical protein ACFX13_008369 [Malus domestica]|uniref:WRKY domain class transcription factor n=1 Tax=Malus domestica TaxID=3750 RepID=D9ZJE8_MALDO|nr:probable WRKY transcription factor 35 [Malus domestica]XP_050112638.1 probable WRKY transcription factor 35 isoform X1 [Malus sylvestris]ADL36851.1 WRKY domain class transcription factor [Malus domestica]
MDETLSPEPDSDVSRNLRPETQPSKRRKVAHEKTVVTVKIGANVGKLKNEGPPSDLWSWRKYGQKPIKGSPYPRGYYRCSTSKGCSAKKQVERSKTDASVLIITYTSSHNHPGPPDVNVISTTQQEQEDEQTQQEQEDDQKQEQEQEDDQEQEQDQKQDQDKKQDHEQEHGKLEERFHYIESPIRSSQEEHIFTAHDTSFGFLLDEEQEPLSLSYSQLMSFSTPKLSEENNDFFDELEELPTFSSFPSFMGRTNNLSFGIERIPSVPS